MSNQKKHYYVGLDIGGTTIKSVMIDETGNQTGEMVEVRSYASQGYRYTFVQLEKAVQLLADKIGTSVSSIRGIGMDVPSLNCNGVIWGQANLSKDWFGTNIQQLFSEHIGVPVYMTNDGNAAALGEYKIRKKRSGGLMFLAPGTGLGGGLILPDGKVYEGTNNLSMEVGHITVPFREPDGELPTCSCGLRGCLEAWVSLIALQRRLKIELADQIWINHPLNKDHSSIEEKAFRLRDFAEKNDPLAIKIFKQQGYIFGYGIADLVRLLDPGLVVIGGGLAETTFRDQYMKWIRKGFKERAWEVYLKNPFDSKKVTTRIEWAKSGDFAGALGMAYMAIEKLK
ncbi:ROK family protein [bacterium]|nr:ROK family protein [bacterium]RQV95729.1 MAG: ROK family protein [bacterium]